MKYLVVVVAMLVVATATPGQRAQADTPDPGYPRAGDLWGWWQKKSDGWTYDEMARIDLWLGIDPTDTTTMAELRKRNPDIVLLGSINTVEATGYPDSYYLKDTDGSKIEVWPGSYRLNLTKPEVAHAQAEAAYQIMVDSGMALDGMFFDNVMTTQSWLTHDIWGDPVHIDADENGIEDDPDVFDAAWKAGVFAEMTEFRRLAPDAVVMNHSTNVNEPGITDLFNGMSYGFRTADIIEGERSFDAVLDDYLSWYGAGVDPVLVMFEGSPIDDIAYGYDYQPLSKIPPSTLEFARDYYPWMRFGLGLTLLGDGYYAYEYGDTWHGNPWWYDEYDFPLGQPVGAARNVSSQGAGPNLIVNPGFASALASTWTMWVNTAKGSAATLTRDATGGRGSSAAAKVAVTAAGGANTVEFRQGNLTFTGGVDYQLSFWARSDTNQRITVSALKNSPDWDWYGLWGEAQVGSSWKQYTYTFTASADASDAKITILSGAATGNLWIDDVVLRTAAADVWRRDYTGGSVIVNGTAELQTVTVGAGFRRFEGDQAPMTQRIFDDADAGFTTSGSWSATHLDSGEWTATGPFFHDWGDTLQTGTGTSTWNLDLPTDDTYTISAWWPAGPDASGWNAAVRYDIVSNGAVVATEIFDQRSSGDTWHTIGSVPLSAGATTEVRMTCSGAPCAADAVYVESAGRFNDGSGASSVTLDPFDAILLEGTNSSGPFGDVPTDHLFVTAITWLADKGITRGCNPPVNDLYCPDDSVTRGQMAAFLTRALHLPASSVDRFVDDEDSVFEDNINRIAEAGITHGCNPPANDHFCPNDLVTRGQMASFLTRALALEASAADPFSDDAGNVHEANIAALAASHITLGCNPPVNDRYCPSDPVSRGQMAAFLYRGRDRLPE